MGLQDIIFAPIYFAILYGIFSSQKRKYTNKINRKYFTQALQAKFAGAIALGLIYYYYYGGGDTTLYFDLGRYISRSFYESPTAFFKLIFSPIDNHDSSLYRYVGMNLFYTKGDSETYFFIRLVAVCNLLSFNTYAVSAMFFACFSMIGSWAIYLVFIDVYPQLTKQLGLAVLFIPSVVFWGSGMMKDSITLGSIGLIFYGFYAVFIKKKSIPTGIILLSIGLFVIISVRVHYLYCLIPALMLWIYLKFRDNIKSKALKVIVTPFLLAIGLVLGYFASIKLTEESSYNIDNLANKTMVTATYLQSVGQGSAYNLGTYDGTLTGMAKLFPQAVGTALFRPFLWEVRNPVALIAAIEASLFLFFTLRLLVKVKLRRLIRVIFDEHVVFVSLAFAIAFSYSVGVASGNFGTLVRYKIQMMPFYTAALVIITHLTKKPTRKAATVQRIVMPRRELITDDASVKLEG
ncbi:MAG: hypothetical protein EAZ08_05395 [Cytophagales bacterium]|nr:MAG: hypothetical protein EAZ08_05395 [Cytophagales bacterium]